MDPLDLKFRKSIHRRYDPEPKGPRIPLWLAIVMSLFLIGAAVMGFVGN